MDCSACKFKVSSEKQKNQIIKEVKLREESYLAKHLNDLQSKKWKKAKQEILSYDQYTCQICGIVFSKLDRNRLNVHHIKRNSGNENLTPKGLVTLCTKCHNLLHGPSACFFHGCFEIFEKEGFLFDSSWSKVNPDGLKKLEHFYSLVKQAEIANKDRFQKPLESVMAQLCFLCPDLRTCLMGELLIEQVLHQPNAPGRILMKDNETLFMNSKEIFDAKSKQALLIQKYIAMKKSENSPSEVYANTEIKILKRLKSG